MAGYIHESYIYTEAVYMWEIYMCIAIPVWALRWCVTVGFDCIDQIITVLSLLADAR